MLTRQPAPSLTSADLEANLHDIQDNVVTPILMRYGRHIFVKFTDGAKARAFLLGLFRREIFLNPMSTKFYVSLAHGPADVAVFLEAARAALRDR